MGFGHLGLSCQGLLFNVPGTLRVLPSPTMRACYGRPEHCFLPGECELALLLADSAKLSPRAAETQQSLVGRGACPAPQGRGGREATTFCSCVSEAASHFGSRLLPQAFVSGGRRSGPGSCAENPGACSLLGGSEGWGWGDAVLGQVPWGSRGAAGAAAQAPRSLLSRPTPTGGNAVQAVGAL